MRNIKLTIQYEGTNYSGWQSQKNAVSIQEVIQEALKKILGHKAANTGSGRTDAGVHALGQIANFPTASKISLKKIYMALNSMLPKDIVISRVGEAGPKFNAQRSAKSKLYRYTLVNGDFIDPFIRRFAARSFYKLDIGLMRKAAGKLTGRHDFSAFRATDKDPGKESMRSIKVLRIERTGNVMNFFVEADGFVYNMVRNIVGTLVEIGRGKFPVSRAAELIKKKDRRLCGPKMPAKGLCLMRVKY